MTCEICGESNPNTFFVPDKAFHKDCIEHHYGDADNILRYIAFYHDHCVNLSLETLYENMQRWDVSYLDMYAKTHHHDWPGFFNHYSNEVKNEGDRQKLLEIFDYVFQLKLF